MEGDMTPITADMTDDTPACEQLGGDVEQVDGLPMNGHANGASPSVAEAIAERELKGILEAMLFVSPEPLSVARLMAVLGDVTKDELERVLRSLGDDLEQEGRGVRLAEIAGGFRLVTKQEYSAWVKRLDKAKSTAKLSRSALESLAIIAYKQPIVRSEIEEIRGVETSGVVRTLLERKLVRIVGRKEVPGRPIMYGTTKQFLEHFGLNDLSQLPPLREFKELGEAEQSLLPMDAGVSTDEAASEAVGVQGQGSPRDGKEAEDPVSEVAIEEGDEGTDFFGGREAGAIVVEAAAEEPAEEMDRDEIEEEEATDFSLAMAQPSDELAAGDEGKIDEELMGEPVEQ
jgi:segregation and condensation protein B